MDQGRRPDKLKGGYKRNNLTIRMNDELANEVRTRAERAGINKGAWIREIIEDSIKEDING